MNLNRQALQMLEILNSAKQACNALIAFTLTTNLQQ
jgi:hypothetical protein